ncbi:hypothetical protein ACQEU6_24660 [Spirillospora sp. CA-108201]
MGPAKSLIQDASHFATFRRPDQFLDLMRTKVRPLLARQPVTW